MISVIGYENQNNVIYYIVQYGEAHLQKRFSQFEELHQSLLPYFPLPNLPPKSYVTVLLGKSIEQLEKRQKGLDLYMNELYKNPRIVKSYQFQLFLGLAQQAQMIYEFEGVMMPIKDFTINFDLGLMFVLGQESKKIPSILNKVNQNQQFLGSLECWIQKEEIFQKEWTHSFVKQPTCLHHNDYTVAIGFDDGSCTLILVNQNYDITSLKEFNMHNSKALGIHIHNGNLHSISSDEYKVFSMNKNELLNSQLLKDANFLLLDQEKVFISEQAGTILVYDISHDTAQLILKIESQVENIKGMSRSDKRLYCVGLLGTICVIETETFTIIQKAKGKPQSKEISCSEIHEMVFVGNKDGTLTCYDNEDYSPIYITKAHIGSISRICIFQNENLFITAGQDRYIRAWRIPIQVAHSEGQQHSSLKQQQS